MRRETREFPVKEGAGKDLDNEGVTGRQVQGEDVPIGYGKSDNDLSEKKRCNERKEVKGRSNSTGKNKKKRREERGERRIPSFEVLKLGHRF